MYVVLNLFLLSLCLYLIITYKNKITYSNKSVVEGRKIV